MGAQHTEVLLPVGVLAAASAILLRPEHAPALVWVLIGLALYTLVQLVPLPFAWVEALSPSAADVWRGALEPFGSPAPRFIPLTVDPGATALEVLKWFAYACVLLAASGWRARKGPQGLALLVFGSALAVAAVTLVHGIVEASRIYGLFVPNGIARWTRGPIINANALAGYLNLGLFAGLGVSFAQRESWWARAAPVGVAVLALNVFLTHSRGGVGALAIGAAAFAFIIIRQRRPDWRRVGALVTGAVLLALVVALGLAGAEARAELLDPALGGKKLAWLWSLDLIRDFPVFGAGRGAFETAFQPYRRPQGHDWTMVFAYAENFPIEWLCGWGIPVGLVVLGAFLLSIPGVVRRALREPLAAGLCAGLGTLFLQNLVDLALEVFAVMATALVAFAAFGRARAPQRGWRIRVGIAVLGVGVGAVIVIATGATPVKVERDRLARTYKSFVASRSRDTAPIIGELRASVLRHPGEAYFPLIGALVARRTPRGDPLRWLGRALERAPMNGSTHLALAQVLAERGAFRQAMLHVRLTALYDALLRDYALERASSWAKDPEDLIAVFPRGMPGSEFIDELCGKARGELNVGCWREAVERRPSVEARHRLTGALLDALEGSRSPCGGEARARCEHEVDALLGTLSRGRAVDFRMASDRARLAAVRGDFQGAARAALGGCPAIPEAADCLRRGLDFGLAARDLPTLQGIADRYLALRCSTDAECAQANEVIGATYAQMSAWAFALRHFGAAIKAEETTDRWLRNAEAAARIGSVTIARTSLERARSGAELTAEQRVRLAAIEELLRSKDGL